jgi:ABC-type Fe3+ transport system substrate-binding protein
MQQINIGISEENRKQIASGLSKLLADTYTLYLKTHNYHWNVTGPHFQTLHVMFEGQYNELALAVDQIAERIRSLGVMLNSEDKKDVEIAKSLKIFFPAQNTTGTHINISGGGVTKYAKNKENAIKLLEFLSSVEAQEIFAEANHEYPANPKAKISTTVSSWGTFKEDTIPLNEVGKNSKKAVEIATKGNWK